MKWFLLHQDRIHGPFSTEEVENQARARQIPDSALIWGRPQQGWKPLNWWQNQGAKLEAEQPVPKKMRRWHFAFGGTSHGPFAQDQLVNELRNVKDTQDVLLWTKGMPAWAPLHEFHEVMDALGINKREHPRAAISGVATVKIGEITAIGQVVSISPGGCGLMSVQGIEPSQMVQVEIKCEALRDAIRSRAQVRYIDDNGLAGLKFDQLASESRNMIIEYIRSLTEHKAA
jgi:hypothetical protein